MYSLNLRTLVVSSVAILFCCAASVSAGTMGLDELIDGGEFESGDKLFTDFTYTAGGDMPEASDITVTDIIDGDGNYGIRFQGPFADAAGGSGSDALITFTVEATGPGRLISDAHLAGNPDVIGESGFVAVTETFLPDAPDTISIYDIEPNGQVNSAWVYFDEPMKVLRVQKNILAFAGENSAATLSFVDQTFSQVPEPTSLGLLASVVLGALAMRRRNG